MKTGESAPEAHGDIVKVRSSERASDGHSHSSAAPRRERSKPGAPSDHDPEAGHGAAPESSGIDRKLKQLIRLCREQSYLTRGDIEEVFPNGSLTPEDLESLYAKLRSFEVNIVDQAEVDHVQPMGQDDEPPAPRMDCLDDPVRMYLKEMGQVPLLTRTQEVEISKRIEDAEGGVRGILWRFGFTGKEHVALAEKLLAEPPKERFDRVVLDSKLEVRGEHLRVIRRLSKEMAHLDHELDEKYTRWQNGALPEEKARLHEELQQQGVEMLLFARPHSRQGFGRR